MLVCARLLVDNSSNRTKCESREKDKKKAHNGRSLGHSALTIQQTSSIPPSAQFDGNDDGVLRRGTSEKAVGLLKFHGIGMGSANENWWVLVV
jgi:hypothetical protein